jgi:molybdopterin-binding protein
MSQVIRIPISLYKRLENHVTGFDNSPAKIIEKILDFYESNKGLVIDNPVIIPSSPRSNSLEIIYHPDNNPDSFSKDFLEKQLAYIRVYKTDGSIEVFTWRLRESQGFTINSSVKANLMTGRLRGWQEKGIYKAEVSTDNKVTGKVKDVIVHGNLRDVILEDGQRFSTSYQNHSLENLRLYIGKQVILVISPKGFLFDISAA